MNILHADCVKCHKQWFPFGRFQQLALPHSAEVQCPECGHKETIMWLDDQTRKLQTQKKLGLLGNDELKSQITNLEHKLELLTREFELEKKKRELFEVQLEQFSVWAQDREEDFLHIEALAQELNEEQDFREDNK